MRKLWVPKSRSVISPKIWPCIHAFFPKYAPVSTPSSYCIGYRAILTTGPSYYQKCTLCTGSWLGLKPSQNIWKLFHHLEISTLKLNRLRKTRCQTLSSIYPFICFVLVFSFHEIFPLFSSLFSSSIQTKYLFFVTILNLGAKTSAFSQID